MHDEDVGCGPLYELYAAARDADKEGIEIAWELLDVEAAGLDERERDGLRAAVEADDPERLREVTGDLVFVEDDEYDRLDGPVARVLGGLLYAFGYLASFVLFFGTSSPEEVATRLRRAYATVGVRIQDTESVNGVERTVFRCPYRNLGADRYGQRRVCHDVLDRVDDGYATFLARRRDVDYQRPQPCGASACCHSEVAER